MSYTALYRKFRPSRFEEVKGQDHIVVTLRNQIRSDKIQHAYLFTGTRGTGKTSVAKLFAKAINCEHPDGENPCMECESCKAIQSGAGMNVIEIDAASNNGVENIRQIIDEVQYPPTQGKYKVYIIDEVHMLSIGAFNALLKTLEEPPSYVVFILATTEVHKLPITILSRCQRYDFRRISIDDICGRIHELLPVENIEAEDDAIRYVAKMGDGSMRDSLSLLDQCIAFNFGKKLTYDMVLDTLGAVDGKVASDMMRMIVLSDVAGAIRVLEKVIMEGRELTQFVSDLTWYTRNLLLAKESDDISAVVDLSKEGLKRLLQEAAEVSTEAAMRYIRILSELSNKLRYEANKRVLTEITLIRMCKPQMDRNDDAIIPRIREIEKKLENGVVFEGRGSAEAATSSEAPKADIPKAPLLPSLPEDIEKIAKEWNRLIERFDYPEKGYLKEAKPSLGAANELLLVFPRALSRDYFLDCNNCDNHFDVIQNSLNEIAGKEVTVRLELAASEAEYISVYPDITQGLDKISMAVTVEDDE